MIASAMPEPFIADAAGVSTFNPDYLAAEPEVKATPKQVVTYKLNPKAAWYDGTPITAADWNALFSPLYPASTNTNAAVFNSGWKDHFLTTAGPFKFQSYDATAKTYLFVPNEKWWGNKPKLDSIIFRVIDDDSQPTALANGEIDMMDVGPSADYYNKAKVVPNIDIRVAGGPNFRHITINGQSPVLKDVNV